MTYTLPYFFLLLPFLPALNLGSGADVSSVRVIAVLFFIIWAYVALVRRRKIIPKDVSIILLLLLTVLTVVSVAWAEDAGFALRKSVYFVSLIPFVLVLFAAQKETQKKCLKMFVLGAAISALFGVFVMALQFIVPVSVIANGIIKYIGPTLFGVATSGAVTAYPSWFVSIGSETLFRTFLPFPNPHTAALFWGMALVVTVLRRKDMPWVSAILLVAMLTTFSRSAYVLLAFIAVLFVVDVVRRGKINLPKINTLRFVVATLFLVVVVAITPYIATRTQAIFSTTEGSTSVRLALWGDAIAIAAEKPLLGVGIGGYAATLDPMSGYRVPTNAHSTYLELLAELGLLGLTLFIAVLAFSVKAIFQRYKEKAPMASVAASGVLVFAAHAIFEMNLYSPANLIVLMLLLVLATNKKTNITYGA